MSGKGGSTIHTQSGELSFPPPLSQPYLRHHLGLHREPAEDEEVLLHRRWIPTLVGHFLIQAAKFPTPGILIINAQTIAIHEPLKLFLRRQCVSPCARSAEMRLVVPACSGSRVFARSYAAKACEEVCGGGGHQFLMIIKDAMNAQDPMQVNHVAPQASIRQSIPLEAAPTSPTPLPSGRNPWPTQAGARCI